MAMTVISGAMASSTVMFGLRYPEMKKGAGSISGRRRKEDDTLKTMTAADGAAQRVHRLPPMLFYATILSIIICSSLFLPIAFASPSPYYSPNAYPQYSSYGGPLYNSPYSTAGAGGFYGKPSYAFATPYSGGYAAGISAYEGPASGMNTYWQPGTAYPPTYGSLGGVGYGGATSGMYYGAGGGQFPFGGAMGGAYGFSASNGLCRDRSANCAINAFGGSQCGNAMPLRTLCLQSCGVGCLGSNTGSATIPYPPSLSPYYEQQAFGQPGTGYGTAYSTAGGYGNPYNSDAYGGVPVIDQNSVDYGNPTPNGGTGYGGYGTAGSLNGNGYGYGGYGSGIINGAAAAGYGGDVSFACRDSHIYGCQQWVAQGLCQQAPEYMLNYCRASCDFCNANNGGAVGTPPPYGSPLSNSNGYGIAATGSVLPVPGGAGLGANGYGLPYASGNGVPTEYGNNAAGFGTTNGYGIPYAGVGGGAGLSTGNGMPYVVPTTEYGGGGGGGQAIGGIPYGNFPPSPTSSSQFATGPFPAYQTAASIDQYGTNLPGGVPPTGASSLSALNSFYSPFSPYRSLHSAAATKTTSVANERKEEKDKQQQKGAKVLFSDDSSNSDEHSAWTVGLPSPLISSSNGGGGSSSIFDQSPSRMSSADGIGTAASSPSMVASNWLHPSQQQHQSQHSKVVRMDDLVLDKAKSSRKTTRR